MDHKQENNPALLIFFINRWCKPIQQISNIISVLIIQGIHSASKKFDRGSIFKVVKKTLKKKNRSHYDILPEHDMEQTLP